MSCKSFSWKGCYIRNVGGNHLKCGNLRLRRALVIRFHFALCVLHICLCCLSPALLWTDSRGSVQILWPWGAENLLWMETDICFFLHRKVVLGVGESGCHETLKCKSPCRVNVLENMSILQVLCPRCQTGMEVQMEGGREGRQAWEAEMG